MAKDSLTPSIVFTSKPLTRQDSVSPSVLISSLKPDSDSISDTVQTIALPKAYEAIKLTVDIRRDSLSTNIVVPMVYKGRSFHILMPKVKKGAGYVTPPFGKIFVRGKWRLLTTNITLKEETLINKIITYEPDIVADSVTSSIQILP